MSLRELSNECILDFARVWRLAWHGLSPYTRVLIWKLRLVQGSIPQTSQSMAKRTAGGVLAKRPTGAKHSAGAEVPLGDGGIREGDGSRAGSAQLGGAKRWRCRRHRWDVRQRGEAAAASVVHKIAAAPGAAQRWTASPRAGSQGSAALLRWRERRAALESDLDQIDLQRAETAAASDKQKAATAEGTSEPTLAELTEVITASGAAPGGSKSPSF